jgi:hypothetical protein
MTDLLFGLLTGSALTWIFVFLQTRSEYWREFNARRQGSNPPPPIRPQPVGGYQPRPTRRTPNTPPSEP